MIVDNSLERGAAPAGNCLTLIGEVEIQCEIAKEEIQRKSGGLLCTHFKDLDYLLVGEVNRLAQQVW